jgi:hypothetical protein
MHMWRLLIGWYHFTWIYVGSHWIKVDPSSPDLPLPIRLVIYSAALDLDPTAAGREERAHRGKGVNDDVSGSRVRWRPAPVVFNARKYADGVPLEETEAMAR